MEQHSAVDSEDYDTRIAILEAEVRELKNARARMTSIDTMFDQLGRNHTTLSNRVESVASSVSRLLTELGDVSVAQAKMRTDILRALETDITTLREDLRTRHDANTRDLGNTMRAMGEGIRADLRAEMVETRALINRLLERFETMSARLDATHATVQRIDNRAMQ